MSGSPLEAAVRDWYGHALGELALAGQALGRGLPPRGAAFHAQQAAEKALKAALIAAGLDAPRTHDLDHLRSLLPAGWRIHRTHADLARLSDHAVETRYPDDPVGLDRLAAANALRQARSIVRIVAADLARRGFDLSNVTPR